MTNNDIYVHAVALLGEDENSSGITDYRRRAPKLLSAIVSRLSAVSAAIGTDVGDIDCELDSAFPLDERLADACAYFLASLLILDESLELSKRLDELGERQVKQVCKADIGSVREVY